MDIASRLQHYAQWSKMTNAVTPTLPSIWGDRPFAETILGTDITTISCFVYQDSVDVPDKDTPKTALQQWYILLAPDASNIKEGDQISSVTNKKGVLVHRGGSIRNLVIYDHPIRGIEARLAILTPN